MPAEPAKTAENPPCEATSRLMLSGWLLFCTLLLVALGVVLEAFWPVGLVVPTFLLFLLSIVRPPGAKEHHKKKLAQRLQKAGLGYQEEQTENFWSKRTFNEE